MNMKLWIVAGLMAVIACTTAPATPTAIVLERGELAASRYFSYPLLADVSASRSESLANVVQATSTPTILSQIADRDAITPGAGKYLHPARDLHDLAQFDLGAVLRHIATARRYLRDLSALDLGAFFSSAVGELRPDWDRSRQCLPAVA